MIKLTPQDRILHLLSRANWRENHRLSSIFFKGYHWYHATWKTSRKKSLERPCKEIKESKNVKN